MYKKLATEKRLKGNRKKRIKRIKNKEKEEKG